jgi:hypothetical protein
MLFFCEEVELVLLLAFVVLVFFSNALSTHWPVLLNVKAVTQETHPFLVASLQVKQLVSQATHFAVIGSGNAPVGQFLMQLPLTPNTSGD